MSNRGEIELIVPLQPAEIEQRLAQLVADYRPRLIPRPLAIQGLSFRVVLWLTRYQQTPRSVIVSLKGTLAPRGDRTRLQATFKPGPNSAQWIGVLFPVAVFAGLTYLSAGSWQFIAFLVPFLMLWTWFLGSLVVIPQQLLIDTLQAYLTPQPPEPPVRPAPRPITVGALIAGLVSLVSTNAFVAWELRSYGPGSGVRTGLWALAALSALGWSIFLVRWSTQPRAN